MQFKHQALALVGIFIAWVFIINIVNTSDLDADEARHASQGLIIKAYVERVMDQGYVSYRTFLDKELTSRYPLARFYGLYDPPLHAMILATLFSIFDPNIATARLGSQLIIGVLLPLLYLFMKDLLGDPKTALGATALFLLLPPVFLGGRQVMLTIPVAILTAGWYYFTFRNGHPHTIAETLRKAIYGGLCLAGASLMMYQTLVYVPLFMVAYAAIEVSRHGRQIMKEYKTSVITVLLLQAVVVALCVPWWWQISFSNSTIFSMIAEAGTQEVKGGIQGSITYWLSFVTQLLTETYFLAILAAVALLDRQWVKRHWPIILFVGVALFSATLMLSNRQLRYVGHILPGVAAMMIPGARLLANKMGFSTRQSIGLFVACLLILGGTDLASAFSYSRDQGVFTTAYDYLASQPSPKTIVGLEISGDRDPYPYMHTMDTIMFNLMAIDVPGQTSYSFNVGSKRGLAVALDQINGADLYVLAFGPALATPMGKQTHQLLTDNRFEIISREPYVLYHHKSAKPKPYLFPSIEDSKYAEGYVAKSEPFVLAKKYKEAAEILALGLERDPFHMRLRLALATAHIMHAADAQDQGDSKTAREALKAGQKVYPWILDELQDSPVRVRLETLLGNQTRTNSSAVAQNASA